VCEGGGGGGVGVGVMCVSVTLTDCNEIDQLSLTQCTVCIYKDNLGLKKLAQFLKIKKKHIFENGRSCQIFVQYCFLSKLLVVLTQILTAMEFKEPHF
jgi:hypothetical protein